MMRPRRFLRPKPATLVTQRKFWLQYWQPSTSTTQDFWKYMVVRLSDVPNYTEYTALFDNFRICAFKYEFMPRFSAFDGANTTDTTLPGLTNNTGTRLHIIKDPYARVSPVGTYTSATFNTFIENGNVQSYSGDKKITVYIPNPTINQLTVSSGENTKRRAPWLSTVDTTVVHGGFHCFAQDNNFSALFGQSWDVFVTVYMQFKGAK